MSGRAESVKNLFGVVSLQTGLLLRWSNAFGRVLEVIEPPKNPAKAVTPAGPVAALPIEFRCTKCRQVFDGDVGAVTFPTTADQRPKFERPVTCPRCGELDVEKGEVELTEIGQSQMTDLWMGEGE